MMLNFILILVAIFLVFINGIFVAAEFAMVKLRQGQLTTIQKSTKLNDKIIREIHARLDSYLSACQLGITLASLALGWIGEPQVAKLITPVLKLINITSSLTINTVAFGLAFILISFIHIVIGELLPKSLAIRFPWGTSQVIAIPLYVFYYITFPAIWVLNACSNLILKLIINPNKKREEEFYSTREIKHILHSSHAYGEITPYEAKIMEHTLDFADLRISEVMRPDDELISLNWDMTLLEALKIIRQEKYTRYPLINPINHQIAGLVHVKDIFLNPNKKQSLKELRRPILKLKETSSALEVLRQFRRGLPHLAVIYNQQDLVGFVTMDNLLHIIIGRIRDEFNYTFDDWIVKSENQIIVDGDCTIYSLEQAIHMEIPDNELGLANNVQELLVNRLGRMPKLQEKIQLNEFSAIIGEIEAGELKNILIEFTPLQK